MDTSDTREWERRAQTDGQFAIAVALIEMTTAIYRVAEIMNTPSMLERRADALVDAINASGDDAATAAQLERLADAADRFVPGAEE